MKYLLILIVLALLGAFIYWRLRPYIATARRVLGFMRELRRVNTNGSTKESVQRSTMENERLVRCQACETWIPATRAVVLNRSRRGASSYYCSHVCLERAAEANQPARPRRREGI